VHISPTFLDSLVVELQKKYGVYATEYSSYLFSTEKKNNAQTNYVINSNIENTVNNLSINKINGSKPEDNNHQ